MSEARMRHAVIVGCMLGLGGTAHAAAPNMKEGLWEITVKMDMAGMPASMPPRTMQQCITRKDLEDPRKVTPSADSRDSRCEVTDHKVQGNTATWRITCKGAQEMTGNGSITYSGTSYNGSTHITMKQGNQTTAMTMNYAGKYVGDCKGPAAKP
jgi:hypothetical protein